MATVNKRTGEPQAVVINGIDAGGVMTARIQAGFENNIHSAPDGLQVPLKDKEIQYVRGTVVTQDWPHAIELLTGAATTLVFYERKRGVAAANGYIKHTITNPVIHRIDIAVTKGAYMTVAFAFECKAADETSGVSAMWAIADDQTPPTDLAAARGGYRVITTAHSSAGTLIDIYHVTAFNLTITMRIAKACNDGDVGYTCVDAVLTGITCSGSISFQDSGIATALLTAQQLLLAAADDLVLTLRQSQGAANKTLTIANVDFSSIGGDASAETDFTGHTVNFEVVNDFSAPLTLDGANEIVTIA